MAGIEDYVNSLRQKDGQRSESSPTNLGALKNIYPAIVIQENDPLEQGRIIARIVSVDQEGNISGGRDRNIPDMSLPWAIPMQMGFIHARPLPGEMVFILLENPSEITAPRYWVGPIITSQLKLKFQGFKEAIKIFSRTNFNPNQKLKSRIEPSLRLPERIDVALQGRDDAHVILKPKEVFIAAGLFEPNTLKANLQTPAQISVRQILNDNPEARLTRYSTTEIVSNVINLYSNRGKFRAEELKKFEANEDLEDLGVLSDSLHPAVFGDELVKVLDLIIRVLLNHIHTPQNPLIRTPESSSLSRYTTLGELQNLISNHIRIN